MKSSKTRTLFSLLLGIILITQSCTIYEKTPSSFEEAYKKHHKMKMVIADKAYRVQAMESSDNQLLVKANRGSKLPAQYPEYIVKKNKKYTIMDASEIPITSIYAKNITESKISTIIVSIFSAGLLTGGIIWLASSQSSHLFKIR